MIIGIFKLKKGQKNEKKARGLYLNIFNLFGLFVNTKMTVENVDVFIG